MFRHVELLKRDNDSIKRVEHFGCFSLLRSPLFAVIALPAAQQRIHVQWVACKHVSAADSPSSRHTAFIPTGCALAPVVDRHTAFTHTGCALAPVVDRLTFEVFWVFRCTAFIPTGCALAPALRSSLQAAPWHPHCVHPNSLLRHLSHTAFVPTGRLLPPVVDPLTVSVVTTRQLQMRQIIMIATPLSSPQAAFPHLSLWRPFPFSRVLALPYSPRPPSRPRALPRLSAALPFRAPPAPSLPAPALCLSSRCCLLLLLNSCVSPPAVCTSLLLLCRPLSTRPLLCFHLRVYHRVLVSASLRSSCCSCCLPLVIIACNYAAGRERAGERANARERRTGVGERERDRVARVCWLHVCWDNHRLQEKTPPSLLQDLEAPPEGHLRSGCCASAVCTSAGTTAGADGKTRVNMKKGNERVGQPEDAGGLRTFGGAFEEILARVTSE
ncbi:unnamed protein product [Closterium sp. NIES-65]|nr:unnamed protein product [Closterium sp. NIES-65]